MKFIFLIALAGLSLNSFAQINGAYTRDGEAYSFQKDGTFDWIRTSESTISYGNGNYKVDGKTITLSFIQARLQPDIQLNESPPTTSEKSIVEIRIMYSNGQPTPRTNISFVQSKVTERTNEQGILKLDLSDPVAKDKIVIDVDGRKSAAIPIELKGHNTLLGIVIDETAHYKDNQAETLPFKQKRGKIRINKKWFKKTS